MESKDIVEIPQILHFIWHGSVLNEEKQKRLEKWRRLNPDYEINVWYDPTLLNDQELEEFETWAQQNNINLRDTAELGYDEDAEYESAGPFPNYSARSDIERYKILKKFGGVYLDVDILSTEKALPIFIALRGVLFNQFSQDERAIGTDIVAAFPEIEILDEIIDKLKTNYLLEELPEDLHMHVTMAFERAVKKSGPTFLRELLYQVGLVSSPECSEAVLDREYWIDSKCFKGEKNDLSWIVLEKFGKKIEARLAQKNYDSMDSFMNDIVIRVSYELSHSKKSLLNEYLHYAPGELTEDFISKLNEELNARVTPRDQEQLKLEMDHAIEQMNQINLEQQHEKIFEGLKKYLFQIEWEMPGLFQTKTKMTLAQEGVRKNLPDAITNALDLIDEYQRNKQRGIISDSQKVFDELKFFTKDLQEISMQAPWASAAKDLLRLSLLLNQDEDELLDSLQVNVLQAARLQ